MYTIFGYQIAKRVIAMVAAAVVLLLVVSLTLYQCDKRRSERAQSRVEAAQTKAATESGADAINTVTAAGARETASEAQTRESEREIRAAPGASDRVNPGVNTAGLKALCKREAYKNSERCKIFRKEPTR